MTEKELQDFIVREVRNYVASAAAKPYVRQRNTTH